MGENEDIPHQIWDAAKAALREKFSYKYLHLKGERYQNKKSNALS